MTGGRPGVELLWWEDCPSWQDAREMLEAAMSEIGLDPNSLQTTRIDSAGQALRERFVGSPTIRVDGRDIAEAPDDEPYGLTCRVYHLRDGRASPLPDPLDLREALERSR